VICDAIDVRRASLLQIQCGVLEHEQACVDAGRSPWPDEIRRRIGKEISDWRRKNPDRAVLCTRSFAMPGQCTVEMIYHVVPTELAPPVMRRARSAPPRPAIQAAQSCATCGDR
jgi:hypothetical protein